MTNKPAANKSTKGLQCFCIPPERFISAPVEALLQDLQDTLSSQHGGATKPSTETFRRVARLIESTSQFDFLDARRRIRESFLTFASAANGKAIPDANGEEPSPEDLDEQEITFLEDIHQLMQAAHFRLLSADDWKTAQAEQFTFNSPVEVNWEYMDTELMQRYWANHEAECAGTAPISNRILVFHRGISTVRAQGQYMNDKIDLLIEYLLVDPFQALYRRVFKHEAKLHVALDLGEAGGDQGYTFADGPAAARGRKPGSSAAGGPVREIEMQGVGADSTGQPEDDSSLQHSATQTVQRRSLRSIMPDAHAVFENFFKQLDIQEPAFKNVVVLYRRKVADTPQRKSEYEPIRKHNVRLKPAQALERRNINIKRFDEIPMADAEMVFPDKKIFLKPLLIIQLLIAIIGGVVATFAALLSGKLSGQVLLATLSVVGTRAMQVYTSAQFARARVVDQITMQLYEQTMDAQEGVVYFLLEEMAQQRIKENLLAYALLLIRGVPLTQRQLDDACEAHLQQRFGEKLDFAVENSLPFLIHDGLIKETGDGALEAVSLETAYNKLAAKWQGYFARSRDDGDHGDSDAAPLPGKGTRRSLFQKSRIPSRSQESQARSGTAGSSQPASTTVDKRSGIITVGDSVEPQGAEETKENHSSGSRRSRLKEGLSSLIGKGSSKDQ